MWIRSSVGWTPERFLRSNQPRVMSLTFPHAQEVQSSVLAVPFPIMVRGFLPTHRKAGWAPAKRQAWASVLCAVSLMVNMSSLQSIRAQAIDRQRQ